MKQNALIRGRVKALTTFAAGAAAAILALPAQAMPIELGELEGSWFNSMSYGMQWRVEERDSALVGRRTAVTGLVPADHQGTLDGVNTDDGNLNYDKGDLIAAAFKFNSELDLSYRNYSAYVRFAALYDYINDTDCVHDGGCNDANFTGHLRRNQGTRKHNATYAKFLDAYIRGDFDIGSRTLSLKVGQYVLNWGESTVIPFGINISPLDIPALRIPGAEIRDVSKVVPMVSAILDLTETLTMEAFYRLRFEENTIDPIGSYFSTNDFLSDGAKFIMLGFGQLPEGTPGATVFRSPTREAKDSGQFGVAFNYFSEALNDTEFGLYIQQYHSHLPLASGIARSTSSQTGSYFVEYPEDIKKYGVSFNTNVSGFAVSGEYSFTEDNPLFLEDIDLLLTALGLPSVINEFRRGDAAAFPGSGAYIRGYERKNTSQAQFTLLKTTGQNNPLKAQDVLFLAEFGAHYVHDMEDIETLRYEGPNTPLPFSVAGIPASAQPLNGATQDPDGYADDFSWGYRLISRLSYLSVRPGVNIFPRVIFFHDVKGTTPSPTIAFVEGRKSVGLGTNIEYGDKLSFDFSYNLYFGGGVGNGISDRDNMGFNVKYAF